MRIAVLGLGSAGRRHAIELIEQGHEVIGFDPAGTTVDGVRALGSLEEALATGPDAVVVASPNSLHAEHALAALEAGAHVLVEKPLAVTAPDAEEVCRAAERSGRICGVAMNLRFHPGVATLRRLVDSGELGRLLLGRASFGFDLRRWRPGADYRSGYSARSDLGGGIVLDAIHELDLLLWLVGPVASVSAQTATVSDLEVDVEDVAVAALRFRSGAAGALDLNFFEPAYRRSLLLVGADAAAVWDWNEAAVTVRSDRRDERIDATCDVAETYRAELADFVLAAEQGRPPRTPAAEGLAAVRLAEGVKRAANEGRSVAL